MKEKGKQERDERHNLFNKEPASKRLKSRSSFLSSTEPLEGSPELMRQYKWQEQWHNHQSHLKQFITSPREALPLGSNLSWRQWRAANRIRTGKTATPADKKKWGYIDSDVCSCGMSSCDLDHLLQECNLYGTRPTNADIAGMTETMVKWLEEAADTIWLKTT